MNDLEIIYDHYKETCDLSKTAQEKRNKEFVILCFLEALSFLILMQSDIAVETILNIINRGTEVPIMLGTSIIQTLLWIFVLYVLVRYCQNSIYVERQYKYIEKLEKSISPKLDGFEFSRESENYLKEYPRILDVIYIFYTWFAPILFSIINILRIYVEWISYKLNLVLLCDSAIFIAIIVVSALYLSALHPNLKTKIGKILHIKL